MRPHATHHVVARARIATTNGRLLLVMPNRPNAPYYFPGGLVKDGEAPGDTCDREIYEALNLPLSYHDLLNTAWAPPKTPAAPSSLTFLYDYGTYDTQQIISNISLNPARVADWALMTPEDALEVLHPNQKDLMHAGLAGVRYVNQRQKPLATHPPFEPTRHAQPTRRCLALRR